MSVQAANLLVRHGEVPARCVELYPDAAAWRRARLSRPMLGASDIARVRGILPSEWGSAWDTWTRLTSLLDGRQQPAPRETSAQRRGHLLEGPALRLWAQESGGRVIHCGREPIIVRHPDLDWAACSPDALAVMPDGEVLGVEVKTAEDMRGWGSPCVIPAEIPAGYRWPVPPWYATQVYWTMALCGLPWLLVCLGPFFRVPAWRLERSPAIERELLDHAAAWWERHIVDRILPDVDGSQACARWVGRDPGEGLRAPRQAIEQETRLLRQYAELRAQKRDLDGILPVLLNRILDLAGPVEGLRVGKHLVTITRREGRMPTLDNLEALERPQETP